MNSDKNAYDIIVIGGGIIGLTFACAMAPSLLKIAILDKEEKSCGWSAAYYDERVFALTVASRSILHALGCWQWIKEMRIADFRHMHVWDQEKLGEIHFDSYEVGQSVLGTIVENQVIKQALENKIKNFPNIDYFNNITLSDYKQLGNQHQVKTTSGHSFSAALLVAADGANSWLRQATGIPGVTQSYHQHAITTAVETEKPHLNTAWQHFLPSGPLAFLPLADNTCSIASNTLQRQCSIVWSSDSIYAKMLYQMDEELFKQRLGEALNYRLGAITKVGKRQIFPLVMRHAKHYVLPGIALIGDAAHTLHPLAGQGLNMGMLDAAVLAEVISKALQKKRSFADLSTLRQYERWRRTDNLIMIGVMEAFKRMFGAKNTAVYLIRNLGLKMTDNSFPVKHQVMRHAMGLAGKLPEMAQQSLLL